MYPLILYSANNQPMNHIHRTIQQYIQNKNRKHWECDKKSNTQANQGIHSLEISCFRKGDSHYSN